MKRLAGFCIWMVIAVALLLAVDQAMVRLPAGVGGEYRQSYLEWRQKVPAAAKEEEAPLAATPRYVYVDDEGGLHFADSLGEIPSPFRAEAQRLGD